MARFLVAFMLITVSLPAAAQTCGPDPAPSQAAAQGYTCETFRWTCGGGGTGCATGAGDTASEIDDGTGQLGKKWYFGRTNINGHQTVPSDFSVTGNGKIVTQTSVPADHGAFVLNTCYAPTGSFVWTGGQFFQNGFYAEAVLEWNSTGHPGVQTGLYGFEGYWNPMVGGGFQCPGHNFNVCYEADLPDAFAFDQAVVVWGTTPGLQSNNPQPLPHLSPAIEAGVDAWGLLNTASATTWYFNGATNGSPGVSAYNSSGSPAELFTSKQCFGLESTAEFPLTLDSFKVWQTGGTPPPPPVFYGGRNSLRR